MRSNEVLQELSLISNKINDLLYHTRGSSEYNEVDGKINYSDTSDERLYQDEFKGILERLEMVKGDIEYLKRPIKKTGVLHKNDRGRYETEFMEYTSGNGIEALINEDEIVKWVVSRIEHNGKDYYIVGYSGINLEGLEVRIRE